MYFDDLEIGYKAELGSHTFTAEEIVAFAKRWDPQPFHVDPEKAKQTLFGSLCASGWHTACMWMRLNVDDGVRRTEAAAAAGEPPPRFGPSPGIFDLKWPRPVYVGDTVSYSWTIMDKRESKSRPEWGIVTYMAEGHNQDGKPVLTFHGRFFLGRR
jgi:acyl dehydratase